MLTTPALTPPASNPTASALLRRATPNFATSLSAAIDATTATIPLSDTSLLSTDSAVTIVIDPGIAGKVEVLIGFPEGSNLVNAVRHIEGNTVGHDQSAIVYMISTAIDMNSLVDFLRLGLDPTTGLPITNSVASAAIQALAIVTGKVADGAITSAKIADGTIAFADLLATIFSGQIVSDSNPGDAGGSRNALNLGGLKLCWGVTSQQAVSGAGFQATVAKHVTFPTSFFGSTPVAGCWTGPAVNSNYIHGENIALTSTDFQVQLVQNNGGNGAAVIHWFAIGT